MPETVNAKGLACPQPVILSKNALNSHNSIVVLVDNAMALENVKRFASGTGCTFIVAEESEGNFSIHIDKPASKETGSQDPESVLCATEKPSPRIGPTVVVIASDTMGKGSNELGAVLIKAFFHTLTNLETRPDVMIFYNAGVKLTSHGSDVLEDLKIIQECGVKMLICGTCADYFGITEKVGVGIVSNMYDIADNLSRAGRIIKP